MSITHALYALHGHRWWFRVYGTEQEIRNKIAAIRAYREAAGKTPLAFWIVPLLEEPFEQRLRELV